MTFVSRYTVLVNRFSKVLELWIPYTLHGGEIFSIILRGIVREDRFSPPRKAEIEVVKWGR